MSLVTLSDVFTRNVLEKVTQIVPLKQHGGKHDSWSRTCQTFSSVICIRCSSHQTTSYFLEPSQKLRVHVTQLLELVGSFPELSLKLQVIVP